MKCIITIELGTNAVRVFAFDLNGSDRFPKGYCPTFHAELTANRIPSRFLLRCYVLKNLLTDTIYPKKYKVASICLARPCTVCWLLTKRSLGNAITYR
jgi:gluconokinase